MKKIFFTIMIITLLFWGCINNENEKKSENKNEPDKYLEGKYHYCYYYNNGTIDTTFDQYIDFDKNGKCKYLLNMCEGFTIESDSYKIENKIVKILNADYELTMLDSNSLRFNKNVEDFTCNNKGKGDTIVLKK